MDITEVRVKLMEDSDDRLRAFCSVTFDDSFVVRDLKIIDGTSGPFVAMPSRKLTSHCPKCGARITCEPATATIAAGRNRRNVRCAIPRDEPSCTPTLPIRSTRLAAR